MPMDNEVFVYKQNDNNIGYDNIDRDMVRVLSDSLSIIKPGDKVVIKPNFVRQCSIKSKEWIHVITNPKLIEQVLKLAVIKLKEKGEIKILDAPQEDSDFDVLIRNIGLKKIIEEIQRKTSIPISIIDIRTECKKSLNGVIVERKQQVGDPLGYTRIDLAQDSSFTGKQNKNYYGADYNIEEAQGFHNNYNNTYVISNSVLNCDVFINMPKIKTHKIGGMTCCLKNAIGIIGIKNCIPHHTIGTPNNDGDTVPFENSKAKAENSVKNVARSLLNKNIPFVGYFLAISKAIIQPFIGKNFTVIRNGHWYGNDTLWRAILDLNKIIIYCDTNGKICNSPQRKYISIVDGIIAGEKNGPMMPEKKECGIIVVSYNGLICDTVVSRLMGFDYNKIPQIFNGYRLASFKLNNNIIPSDIVVRSNKLEWNKKLNEINSDTTFKFIPAFGWDGHIELDK